MNCFRREPTFVHREVFGVTDDYRTFNDILQLPNIARPGIRLERFQGFVTNTHDLLARFARIAIDEVFDQHRNVFFPVAEWRYLDWKHVDAIEQIATKFICSDGGF